MEEDSWKRRAHRCGLKTREPSGTCANEDDFSSEIEGVEFELSGIGDAAALEVGGRLGLEEIARKIGVTTV